MNWEVDNNNFGGLRIPGVFATPTQGGFQSFASPEDGLTAIAHQLDRYFSGKTTGKPLNTLNQIINTWAPPSDNNPTNALIQRASQIVGVSPDAPLDFSNPDTRAKLIEATVRNEQGGKLPVDPSIIQKVAASYTPGAAAPPSGNNKMLPGFGNARSASQLMPASVEQTGGLPMADPAAIPGGPQLGLAGFGPGGLASPGAVGGMDITEMLPKLMAQAKSMGLVSSPSQMLSNMAAGFLGGKGPAASLAGGFAGLAKAQGQDQSEGNSLLKMAMMYGPLMQQQLREKNMTALAAVTRQGQIPASMAAKGLGMSPQDLGATSWEDVDSAYRSGMPLPATAQKSIQDATGGIASQRNNQVQLKTIRDQIANGDFNLDALHRAEYHILNTIGLPTEASSKYQAMQQTLGNMQADLMNSQKGAASDKRAELALSQLTGGGGLTSNAQAINHFDYLGNHAALAEKNLRQKLEQSYTLSKQKMPADFMEKLDATLPASPYGGVDPNVIGRQLYGDNTTNPNATAAPGQPLAGNTPVAAPVGNTSGALPPGAIRLPDGRIAIPKNP